MKLANVLFMRSTILAFLAAARLARAELAQHTERIDAGVVAVAPGRGERVVPDRLDVGHLLRGEAQVLVHGLMALAAGAGAPAPQVVERVAREVAVVPRDHRAACALLVADLDRLRCAQGSKRIRAIFHSPRSRTTT